MKVEFSQRLHQKIRYAVNTVYGKGDDKQYFDVSEYLDTYKEALKSEGWQPIETAPKDGTWVLSSPKLDFGPAVMPVRWTKIERGHGYWEWLSSSTAQPTHWRPLPEAPQ